MTMLISIVFFILGFIFSIVGFENFDSYMMFFLSGIFAIAYGLLYIGDQIGGKNVKKPENEDKNE